MYLGRLMCNEERTGQRTEPQETPSTEIRDGNQWTYDLISRSSRYMSWTQFLFEKRS